MVLKQAGVQLAVIYLGRGRQAFVSPDGFCGAELEMASVYWPFLGGRCSTGGLWLPAGEVMGLRTLEGLMSSRLGL